MFHTAKQTLPAVTTFCSETFVAKFVPHLHTLRVTSFHLYHLLNALFIPSLVHILVPAPAKAVNNQKGEKKTKGVPEHTFGYCCEGSIHKLHSCYFFCAISSASLHLQHVLWHAAPKLDVLKFWSSADPLAFYLQQNLIRSSFN